MKLQQYLLNHYLHIPFEQFSNRAVAAKGLLITIRNNPLSDLTYDDEKALDKAIKTVTDIIDMTEEKIQVSLFVLDRNVSPQDFSKTPVFYTTKFERKKKVNDETTISMSADQIQRALCEAAMKINDTLMTEISRFSEQIIFDGNDLG